MLVLLYCVVKGKLLFIIVTIILFNVTFRDSLVAREVVGETVNAASE